jgi:hypothetical protein
VEVELAREKEFNASNHRINAEYLVNLLTKFFLCEDLSERQKLVTVICSILHVPQEDIKQITLKWTVKAQQATCQNYEGGIVVGNGAVLRWLLQPADAK